MNNITIQIKLDSERMLYDITSFVGDRGIVEYDRSDNGIYLLVTNGFDEDFKDFKIMDYVRIVR